MVDGSEKRNRQLAFELQNSHVCEKRSNSLLKQNIAAKGMKRAKNNNRSSQQKINFARAAHFFEQFLCRCFARLQRRTLRIFLITRFMEEMSQVGVLVTFFHRRSHSVSIWWPLAFIILSPPLQNFHVVLLLTKKCLACFFSSPSIALSSCRSFSR